MRKLYRVALFVLLGGGLFAEVWAAGIAFGQVFDSLDGASNTKLAAKENWKKLKGQEVIWSGIVHDVDSKGDEAKVYIADKTRSLYKGYNIIIEISDSAKAAVLKRGQAIQFKGILDDYRVKDSGAVIKIEKARLL